MKVQLTDEILEERAAAQSMIKKNELDEAMKVYISFTDKEHNEQSSTGMVSPTFFK